VRQLLAPFIIDNPNVPFRVNLDPVPLVEQHQCGPTSVSNQGRQASVLVGNGFGGIHHQQRDVAALNRPNGPSGRKDFKLVADPGTASNAGCVDDAELLPVHNHD
jgi:hypothetical protein